MVNDGMVCGVEMNRPSTITGSDRHLPCTHKSTAKETRHLVQHQRRSYRFDRTLASHCIDQTTSPEPPKGLGSWLTGRFHHIEQHMYTCTRSWDCSHSQCDPIFSFNRLELSTIELHIDDAIAIPCHKMATGAS